MASSPLQPTFFGVIKSTADALFLFEACLRGERNHVPRRPHDRERGDIVKSGNCFVYEEKSSGIKRWTDGISWSPSRILGNFLIYREVMEQFAPGEKKKAARKTKPEEGPTMTPEEAELLRQACGSLVNSYPFKDKGLVKKTISITYRGVTHHIVSYYTLEDFGSGHLQQPSHDPVMSTMPPRAELYVGQSFRSPIEFAGFSGVWPYPSNLHDQQQPGLLMPGAPSVVHGEHSVVAAGMQPPPQQHTMSPHSLSPGVNDFGSVPGSNFVPNMYHAQQYNQYHQYQQHQPHQPHYDLQMVPQQMPQRMSPQMAQQLQQQLQQQMTQQAPYPMYQQGQMQEYYTGADERTI